MQAATIKITHDRKTGEVISKEILDVTEMDEDKYYGPLVRMLGDDFLKKFKDEAS